MEKDLISEKKEVLQEKAVELSRTFDNLLLSWATGTSKTLAAIKCMEDWWNDEHEKSPEKVYIVLKESNHKDNWIAEFKKWGYEEALDKVEFFCYASLKNYRNTRVGMIILDEVHALSEVREDHLGTIECDKLISLSATVQQTVKARLKAYKPGFYEWHISLNDAISQGLLPEPDMHTLRIPLDDEKQEFLYKANKKDEGELLTAKKYYQRLTNAAQYWDEQYMKQGKTWQYTKSMMLSLDRKRFLANLKTDWIARLLNYLEDKRLICFTGSIAQCNLLGGKEAVNSDVDSIDRRHLIASFNEREIDKLFAVGMLREGMNLEAIDAAIIGQLDRKPGSGEQMSGRAMRSLAPQIYVLAIQGTSDEGYLNTFLKGIDKKFIHEFPLENLK